MLSIAIIRIIVTINIIFTSGKLVHRNLASGNEDGCFVFSKLDTVLGLLVDSNSSVDTPRLNSGFDKSLPSPKPISIHETSNTTTKHKVAVPPAPRKSNLRSTKPPSPARPIGWGEKSDVPLNYDPQIGRKSRKHRDKKTIDSKHLPDAWQNTPTRPDDSIVDPPMPSSDKLTTSIPHVPSAELRQHDAYSMTDVTPAIRRIRQLREEMLLEKEAQALAIKGTRS